MIIEDYRIESTSEGTLLSCVIGGNELWYRFPPGYPVERPGDVLFAACLVPAMRNGERLEVAPALGVSSRLLKAAQTFQAIFSTWFPELKKVEIQARQEEAKTSVRGVGSLYSGGLDGAYTLRQHVDEITHLLFVKGIDMQLDNDALFAETLAANQRAAERCGKVLVPVVSNIRYFGHANRLGWNGWNGVGLSTIGLALGFPKLYIAAGRTYADPHREGSHWMTDPLCSTEATEIVHDGAGTTRHQKLLCIAREDRELLDALRVCWQDAGYNCGRCEKCLRTMAALRSLKLATPSLPPLKSLAPIYSLRLHSPDDVNYYVESYRAALAGGDRALARALAFCILRYHTRAWLVRVDELLLSGGVKRLLNHPFRKPKNGAGSSH